ALRTHPFSLERETSQLLALGPSVRFDSSVEPLRVPLIEGVDRCRAVEVPVTLLREPSADRPGSSTNPTPAECSRSRQPDSKTYGEEDQGTHWCCSPPHASFNLQGI